MRSLLLSLGPFRSHPTAKAALWCAAMVVGGFLAGTGAYAAMSLIGCAANKPHVDNEIEATTAGVDYGGCTVKIHAQDGGTFRDWEKCACDVDVAHHVDSGKCAP